MNDPANLSRPIKILHVVFTLEFGGLENGLVNVTRGLEGESFHVDVFCLNRAGQFAGRLPPGCHVYVAGKEEGFSIRAIRELAKVLREVKPDVLHTHNLGNLIYGSFATGFGTLYPILHSEHGELTEEETTPKRLRLRRRLYRSCRFVHTVSESLRTHLVDLGFQSPQIRAIANGVDGRRFFPGEASAARRRLGLNERGPVLGVVGRFIPSKRHDVVVAAFERLAADWPHAQLLMVGAGGADFDRVTALARRSPSADRIHLAGSQEDPCPWYQTMDLLVLPSLVEGMSNVALEAMACGVPVLSHPSCGAAEVLTSGVDGFVAGLETPELLAAQLKAILAFPERLARVGERARATVMNRFSLTRMVRDYAGLYREAARAPRWWNAASSGMTGRV